MAKVFDEIDDHLRGWVARQRMFFVATAPLSADGSVNVSPKGPIGTLQVIGPRRVAYIDYSGSGGETMAHLRENGRIVVMLCAFEGPPRIVRFHGTGEVVFAGDERFGPLREECAFTDRLTEVREGERGIVVVDVERISDSCGYGVPLMDYQGERSHFDLAKKKKLRTHGPERLIEIEATRNARSIDGLPGTEGAPTRATVRDPAAAAD